MTLNEFLQVHTPSDRLVVKDSAGNEIYRGFVACMRHVENVSAFSFSDLVLRVYTRVVMEG